MSDEDDAEGNVLKVKTPTWRILSFESLIKEEKKITCCNQSRYRGKKGARRISNEPYAFKESSKEAIDE